MNNRIFNVYILIVFFLGVVRPCMSFDFKVMSWNIRYDSKKDKENDWANRKTYLLKYIKKENPDIICLQEVLDHQKNYLVSNLQAYDCVGVGRNDGQKKGEYAPVLFKRKRFDLIESGWFWLSETPDIVGSVGWDAQQTRMVTWVKLKEKKSRKTFIVMSTHFDHIGNKARVHSAELVKTWIASNATDEGVILAGDFNGTKNTEMYKTLLKDNWLIDSFFSAKVRKGVEYTFHGFGMIPQKKRVKIDFVFASNNLIVKEINIPKEENFHGCYCSDHCPIICKFVID